MIYKIYLIKTVVKVETTFAVANINLEMAQHSAECQHILNVSYVLWTTVVPTVTLLHNS